MGFPHTPHERETLVLSKHFGVQEAIGLDGWKKRGGYSALVSDFQHLTLTC